MAYNNNAYGNPPYPTNDFGPMPPPPPYSPVTPPPPPPPPQPQPPPLQPAPPPPAANAFASAGFSDKSVRRAFIRKVYTVLSCQLLVTVVIVCIFSFVPKVRDYVRENVWLYVVSTIAFFVFYIALGCCTHCRRTFPGNYICLAIFTLSLSVVAGSISAYHSTDVVLIALCLSVALCLGLTLFALQSKWDFTLCSGLIVALSLVLLLTGVASMIVYFVAGKNRVLQAIYAGIALLLFSLLLIVDTQMVVGGKRYQLEEEEYIFGALQLYVDIVFIFTTLIGITSSFQ